MDRVLQSRDLNSGLSELMCISQHYVRSWSYLRRFSTYFGSMEGTGRVMLKSRSCCTRGKVSLDWDLNFGEEGKVLLTLPPLCPCQQGHLQWQKDTLVLASILPDTSWYWPRKEETIRGERSPERMKTKEVRKRYNSMHLPFWYFTNIKREQRSRSSWMKRPWHCPQRAKTH